MNIKNKIYLFLALLAPLFLQCTNDSINNNIEADYKASNHPAVTNSGSFPVPGNSGAIVITSFADSIVTISWTPGSDDTTVPADLMYEVAVSETNNITTADEMEQNGTMVLDWTKGISGYGIAGLKADTVYYANVMVMDGDGYKKAYMPVSFITPVGPDTGKFPVPGNNGAIVITSIDYNIVTISWTPGSDDATAAGDLVYRVVISNTNNISTPGEMEHNGTTVLDWTANIDSFGISGLADGTIYYANVMVRDLDGNKKAYSPVSFSTAGVVYILSAGTYTGDMIPLTVSSARASIDGKVQARKAIDYPALTCSHVRAFIGLSSSDSIKNFPANYGVPVKWPVHGPGGATIGYNWADLFDGSISETLFKSGAAGNFWWSGSNPDGSFAVPDNCSGWTDGTSKVNGMSGSAVMLDQTWIASTATNCNVKRDLLYLCW